MEQINYDKQYLNNYYKGGFKGDFIVGLALAGMFIAILVS